MVSLTHTGIHPSVWFKEDQIHHFLNYYILLILKALQHLFFNTLWISLSLYHSYLFVWDVLWLTCSYSNSLSKICPFLLSHLIYLIHITITILFSSVCAQIVIISQTMVCMPGYRSILTPKTVRLMCVHQMLGWLPIQSSSSVLSSLYIPMFQRQDNTGGSSITSSGIPEVYWVSTPASSFKLMFRGCFVWISSVWILAVLRIKDLLLPVQHQFNTALMALWILFSSSWLQEKPWHSWIDFYWTNVSLLSMLKTGLDCSFSSKKA